MLSAILLLMIEKIIFSKLRLTRLYIGGGWQSFSSILKFNRTPVLFFVRVCLKISLPN